VVYALMGGFIWCYEAFRGIKYLFSDCSDKNEKTRRNRIMRETAANVRRNIFTRKSTKEIFVDLYNKIRIS
jgi:hypothetical protein